ncbi:MAG: hypothetical protein ACREQ7_03550 [Candidatus Binatia bacterium]
MTKSSRFIALLFPMLLASWGCENIGLINRDAPDRRGRVDRDRDYRGDGYRDRNLARDEVVGTVERIDDRRNEIHLRTTGGRTMVIQYDPDTNVSNRGRELRVRDLRRGDQILVRLDRNSRGEQYAELIRMNDRNSDASGRY